MRAVISWAGISTLISFNAWCPRSAAEVLPSVPYHRFEVVGSDAVLGQLGNGFRHVGSACLSFQFAAGEGRGEIDDQHQDSISTAAMAKATPDLAPLVGIDIQGHGQGGAEDACIEVRKLFSSMAKPGGEEQGGGLADDAADGQDTAGHDAVHGVGQDDGADHVPACRHLGQGTLPIGLWHGLQALLGRADDGGQDHDDQRQAAG